MACREFVSLHGLRSYCARGNGRGSVSGEKLMTTNLSVDKKKDVYSVIGKNPIRHDGTDKVTGRAQYGADIRLPGMYYGAMLRSPHAHARIVSIDTSEAEAYLGVKADRKSTRLNSSHLVISYAVFCLKKKK